MYKIRKDLSISDEGKEILTIEIISKESKSMLLSCCYIAVTFRECKMRKNFYNGRFYDLIEDSNIKHFYHKVFEFGFIPLIDKPTRV